MMSIQITQVHTQAGSASAPRRLKVAPEKEPFSYRTGPCWKGQSAACIADFPIQRHLETPGFLLIVCAPALRRLLRAVGSPGPSCAMSFFWKNRKTKLHFIYMHDSLFLEVKNLFWITAHKPNFSSTELNFTTIIINFNQKAYFKTPKDQIASEKVTHIIRALKNKI